MKIVRIQEDYWNNARWWVERHCGPHAYRLATVQRGERWQEVEPVEDEYDGHKALRIGNDELADFCDSLYGLNATNRLSYPDYYGEHTTVELLRNNPNLFKAVWQKNINSQKEGVKELCARELWIYRNTTKRVWMYCMCSDVKSYMEAYFEDRNEALRFKLVI